MTYKYEKTFESEEKAMEVGTYFHEVLRGNPDYRDTRILLNVDGPKVTLAEFEDSKTHIHVTEEGDEIVLELFVP